MQERFTVKVAVFLVLMKIEGGHVKVLLQRRKNTGYMDGMYDMSCSGHLEKGESLKRAVVREAKEELGIRILEKDLEFVSLIHPVEEGYLNVFFSTSTYEDTPNIMENEKCDDLSWFRIDELPSNTIWKVRTMLRNLEDGVIYDTSDFCAQEQWMNK